MPSPLPNLVWLRTFEAAARLRNFTLAGQELGLTQTAVSLHVRSLEKTLGCQLCLRRARHLRLTSEGDAYLLSVSQALGDLRTATTNLFGMDEARLLTVRAPISTAALWLAAHLPDFRGQYPGIRVRLVSTIWAGSDADEEIDVDLRLGRSDEHDGPSEVISEETITPIASRDRLGRIDGDGDLRAQPLIHILGYDDLWTRYFSAAGLDPPDTAPAYSVDTSMSALALVSADAGCAMMLTRYARHATLAHHKIDMIGEPIAFSHAHYLTRPRHRRRHKPEVDLFEDWLRRKLSEAP